jgi:hypothetical protein
VSYFSPRVIRQEHVLTLINVDNFQTHVDDPGSWPGDIGQGLHAMYDQSDGEDISMSCSYALECELTKILANNLDPAVGSEGNGDDDGDDDDDSAEYIEMYQRADEQYSDEQYSNEQYMSTLSGSYALPYSKQAHPKFSEYGRCDKRV